jgi:hypothetical protein
VAGGAANNQRTGGSGPDAFVVTEPGSGFDQITDFTTGPDDDRPAFAADVLEDFDPATSNLTAFFDLDGQADGTLFRVDSDGGGDGFVPVALLQGGERDLDRRSGGQPRSEPLDRVLAAGAPPRSRLPIGRRSS